MGMKFQIKKKEFWTLNMGITQSLLSSYLECRQKANLAYKEGWSSTQVSNPLVFGTLFHECLDRSYKFMRHDGKFSGINWDNMVDNVLKDYKEKFVEDGGIWTPENEENHILNEGYIKILLPEYFKRYWKDDSKKEWLAIEKEFKVQYQDGVYLRGKYDRIAQEKEDIVIYDTKTKGRLDPNFQDGATFNLQMMFYVYAYWKETGKLAKRFVFDIVKRPGLRKGAMETLQHFMERVKGDVGPDYFQRIPIAILEDEFQYWVGYEFKHMMDSVWQWAIHGPTYRNPTACETRYGICSMLKICGLKDFTGLYKRKKPFMELT